MLLFREKLNRSSGASGREDASRRLHRSDLTGVVDDAIKSAAGRIQLDTVGGCIQLLRIHRKHLAPIKAGGFRRGVGA